MENNEEEPGAQEAGSSNCLQFNSDLIDVLLQDILTEPESTKEESLEDNESVKIDAAAESEGQLEEIFEDLTKEEEEFLLSAEICLPDSPDKNFTIDLTDDDYGTNFDLPPDEDDVMALDVFNFERNHELEIQSIYKLRSSMEIVRRLTSTQPTKKHRLRDDACRYIARALGETHRNPELVEELMGIMKDLVNDSDGAVSRTMIQIMPALVPCCYGFQPQTRSILRDHLLPTILNALYRGSVCITKASLFEMIDHLYVSDKQFFCGLYMEMLYDKIHTFSRYSTSYDKLPVQLDILPEVCQKLEPQIVEEGIVDRFIELCRNCMKDVRMVCAQELGEIGATVSQECVENKLLPEFVLLCDDPDKTVRHMCCTSFREMSELCTPQTRHTVLGPIFLKFLQSSCTSISRAAVANLGMFISTFHNPDDEAKNEDLPSPQEPDEDENPPLPTEYDSFNFWKLPLPTLDFLPQKSTSNSLSCLPPTPPLSPSTYPLPPKSNYFSDQLDTSDKESYFIDLFPNKCQKSDTYRERDQLRTQYRTYYKALSTKQKVIPAELLEEFLVMSCYDDATDNEYFHCAFNMPAVALTLGPKHWNLLKHCYLNICHGIEINVQHDTTEVIRTIGHSLHIIAEIIGPEQACADLLPVFLGFVKCESRDLLLPLLDHLSALVAAFPLHERHRLLEFDSLKTFFAIIEPESNWRLLLIFIRELESMIPLLQPSDCDKYIARYCHVFLAMQVKGWDRQDRTRFFCTLFQRLVQKDEKIKKKKKKKTSPNRSQTNGRSKKAVDSVIVRLEVICLTHALSLSWSKRQSFVFLAGDLYNSGVLDFPTYCQTVLPYLLALSRDKVANVRLAVAEALSKHILKDEYFQDQDSSVTQSVQQIHNLLLNDRDSDVRHFALV